VHSILGIVIDYLYFYTKVIKTIVMSKLKTIHFEGFDEIFQYCDCLAPMLTPLFVTHSIELEQMKISIKAKIVKSGSYFKAFEVSVWSVLKKYIDSTLNLQIKEWLIAVQSRLVGTEKMVIPSKDYFKMH
jgi:hypothetical protein